MSENTPDTIDHLTGGKGADLKAARGTVWAGLEASHQALFGPGAIADITPAERALVALAVSVWHADEPAAAFYATAALDAGATDTDLAAARAGQGGAERLAALLDEADYSDAEIGDIGNAVAMFAWANRLMLTLGEPERKA